MLSKAVSTVVVAASLMGGIVFAAPETYQTANLVVFGAGTSTAGAATLFRSKNGLEARIAAGDLMMNSSYTLWWVIFNNPAACTDPCGMDDVMDPVLRAAVRTSVFYAAGFVTGLGNTGNVDAHVESGALPQGIDIEFGTGLDPGNGFGAEVHLVIRTHGSTAPGMVDQQIGTFNGACTPICSNVQAAAFMPVD